MLAQGNLLGGDILIKVLAALGAWDWNYVFALRQHPSKCQLAGRAAFRCCDILESINQIEVLLEILTLEPGHAAAPVVGLKVTERPNLAGEEAAAERTIGDEGDAKLPRNAQDLLFRLAAPERIFGL